MSEKPHTVAIGAFVVGALLIAITIVIFALGTGFAQDREKVVMVFEGSVKGLTIGAPVALRGVEIGQVTNVELMLDGDADALIMLVEAELSGKNIKRLGSSPEDVTDGLIARGLRAQLKTPSLLTGLLYIQLDFHPDKRAVLADIETEYTQIPTIPTELEQLTRQIEDVDLAQVTVDLQATIHGLNAFVSDESFQALPARLLDALASLNALSAQLSAQLESSGPRLDQVLERADDTLAGAGDELPRLSGLVQENLATLNGAIAAFEQTMSNMDTLVAPDSATTLQLNRALRELSLASRAVEQLARTLDEQPESLLRGRREDGQ